MRVQGRFEKPTDRRGRLDMTRPPSATRASASTVPRAIVLLRAILRVRDGAGGGYWWVKCGTCECGWQVPHYAECVG